MVEGNSVMRPFGDPRFTFYNWIVGGALCFLLEKKGLNITSVDLFYDKIFSVDLK